MQTLAVLDNVVRIAKRSLRVEILSELKRTLTRENPEYNKHVAIASRNPRMQYAALPPRYIESYDEDAHTFYIPRGALRLLHSLINQYDDQITIIDKRIYFDRNPFFNLKPKIELTDYQRAGLSHMVLAGEGVFCAPCGGGKTVTGLAVITALAQPTLIIAHTMDLISQWYREITDKVAMVDEIGMIGAGQSNVGFVTLATIQTLHSINTNPSYGQDALAKLLSKFGCVLLDECHHVPANSFLDVMNQVPAKYRFGLTATPKRQDGKHFLMTDTIGPIVYEVTDSDLVGAGRSQVVHVNEITTNFYSDRTNDDWTALVTEIVHDNERTNLIVDNIIKRWQQGHFPLVLSDRVYHCQLINAKLRAAGMNSELMIGIIPKVARDKIMLRANANLIDCIVATSVADEGLDIPRLSNVHLTVPSNNKSKIKQRVGRIRRPTPDKVSIVDDYIDANCPGLLRWANNRRNMYKSWDFKYSIPDRV